ncbi:MAG: hypothetical protein PF542_05765 [Nanoarchaeota archaeon]|jgi:hypothetical protein|nr:hypothetical protein [Nanoarchaeota archaeon]
MKKIFGILFIFVLGISFISAIDFDTNSVSCSVLELGKSQVIGYEIPSQVPYKNEIFNLYISEEIFGSIIIKKGILTDFSCEINNNQTYDVYIKNYEVFARFTGEGDIVEILNTAIANKDIEIKGKGMGKKLKWFFSRIGLKWFG